MSKAIELAKHLETLNINNMYKSDFYWTWDKTDDEIEAVFTVADTKKGKTDRIRVCFMVEKDDAASISDVKAEIIE